MVSISRKDNAHMKNFFKFFSHPIIFISLFLVGVIGLSITCYRMGVKDGERWSCTDPSSGFLPDAKRHVMSTGPTIKESIEQSVETQNYYPLNIDTETLLQCEFRDIREIKNTEGSSAKTYNGLVLSITGKDWKTFKRLAENATTADKHEVVLKIGRYTREISAQELEDFVRAGHRWPRIPNK